MYRTYYAWVGQGATTGTPNKNTGFYSMCGDVIAFDSRKARDNYCEQYSERHNSYPVPTSRRDARQYHLGMSVYDYNEYIDTLVVNFY